MEHMFYLIQGTTLQAFRRARVDSFSFWFFGVHRAGRVGHRVSTQLCGYISDRMPCACALYATSIVDASGRELHWKWADAFTVACLSGNATGLYGTPYFSRRANISVYVGKRTLQVFTAPVSEHRSPHHCRFYVTFLFAPQRVDRNTVRRGRGLGGPCRGKLSHEISRLSDLRG